MSEITNAIIKSVDLTSEDHGVLSAWIKLDYGGVQQGFGGYALYFPKSSDHHHLESTAGHFIFRVMEIAGVFHWKDLPGKSIRVKRTHSGVQSIGHILKDDWFTPSEDFADKEESK